MKSIFFSFAALGLLWFGFGCTKNGDLIGTDVSHHYFLESDGAYIPVFVEGNTASNTFVFMLHGGPGGESLIYKELNLLEQIERDFAVVYYDQRCAGSSQGNCSFFDLTVADYVTELELAVDFIQDKYGADASIFLMGHSWGGMLTYSYLIKDQNQEELKGAIIVDGIHTFENYTDITRRQIQTVADEQIRGNRSSDEWEDLLADIRNLGNSKSDISSINSSAFQGEQLLSDDNVLGDSQYSAGDALRFYLFSPRSTVDASINQVGTGLAMIDELVEYNPTADLQKIVLPMSFMWGSFDLVVSPELGQIAMDTIGSEIKEFTLFTKSAHSPMINEQNAFNQEVIQFVNRFR